MTWIEKIGLGLFLVGLTSFLAIPFLGTYSLSEEVVKTNTKAIHQDKMAEILAPMYGQEFSSNFSFLSAFGEKLNTYNEEVKSQQRWDDVIWDDYSFALTRQDCRAQSVTIPGFSLRYLLA
jgi:ferredoxin-type protein NapH